MLPVLPTFSTLCFRLVYKAHVASSPWLYILLSVFRIVLISCMGKNQLNIIFQHLFWYPKSVLLICLRIGLLMMIECNRLLPYFLVTPFLIFCIYSKETKGQWTHIIKSIFSLVPIILTLQLNRGVDEIKWKNTGVPSQITPKRKLCKIFLKQELQLQLQLQLQLELTYLIFLYFILFK